MTIYNTPYTYLIGWSEQNKWYYGVRFAKKCHPNDLWTTYFTSSNYVKKFRKEYGEPDIIEVRKIFTCSQKARDWETKVIKRLNLVESNKWLNKTDNTNKFYHEGPINDKHRKIIADSNKKRIIKDETREKLRKNAIILHNKINITGKNNPNYGKKWNDEQKKKMSNMKKGVRKGTTLSQEHKNKISESRKLAWQKQKMKIGE